MQMGNNETRPDRGDAPGPTERRLVRRDMAWAWPTTTARWAQVTRRNRTQTALRLPKPDLEGPNDGIPIKERPMGFLSPSDGSGDCQEIGKEQWDAPRGPCHLHHERQTRIPFGHIR